MEIRLFDHAELLERYPGFDDLEPAEKLEVIAELVAAGELEPTVEERSTNTTCIGLSESIVKAQDPGDTAGAPVPQHCLLGSGTTAPAYTDRSLTSQHDSVDVSQWENQGESIETRSFIPALAGNDATIAEVGLSWQNVLLNHSLLSPTISKNQGEVATITITLAYTSV